MNCHELKDGVRSRKLLILQFTFFSTFFCNVNSLINGFEEMIDKFLFSLSGKSKLFVQLRSVRRKYWRCEISVGDEKRW